MRLCYPGVFLIKHVFQLLYIFLLIRLDHDCTIKVLSGFSCIFAWATLYSTINGQKVSIGFMAYLVVFGMFRSYAH